MKELDSTLKAANKFLRDQVFEIFTQPDGGPSIPTNVKVVLTGVKDYISFGENRPYVEYRLEILPTNKESDRWNGILNDIYGEETIINTRSYEYSDLRFVVNHKIGDILKYFGFDDRVICTKVINKVTNKKMNESLLIEGKYDGITRTLVRDIITFFKHQRDGEFSLPEDIGGEDEYSFPNLNKNFSIFLDLQLDENVNGFDVDAEYWDDEEIIYLTIISNPNSEYNLLQDLTKELNEILRHELEHIKQYNQGYEFPKEPKDHEKYYTQQHELEAQRSGFKRRSKQEKIPLEKVVRDWFEKNKNKYKMTPDQVERVIQKIIEK